MARSAGQAKVMKLPPLPPEHLTTLTIARFLTWLQREHRVARCTIGLHKAHLTIPTNGSQRVLLTSAIQRAQ